MLIHKAVASSYIVVYPTGFCASSHSTNECRSEIEFSGVKYKRGSRNYAIVTKPSIVAYNKNGITVIVCISARCCG